MILRSRRQLMQSALLGGLTAPAIVRSLRAQGLTEDLRPNQPDILNGFAARRPSGTVAGVDYFVGCPMRDLITPTVRNIPSGTTIDDNLRLLTITGKHVTIGGFMLDGYTVLVGDSADGIVTVENCAGVPVVIRSVVGANASLVVQNCTLDGGSGPGDFRLITYFGNGFCVVRNCWLKNSNLGGVHSGGVTITVQNNLFEKFGWTSGTHANGVYLAGGKDPSAVVNISGNTFYSGKSRDSVGFPIGIGIGISLFADGGNYYNSVLCDNTIIMDLPGSASSAIGYYIPSPARAVGGNVQNNYLHSSNGFGKGNGCIEPFYTGSTGLVVAFYSGNVDMRTGAVISPPRLRH
jgi:hypothetical protein